MLLGRRLCAQLDWTPVTKGFYSIRNLESELHSGEIFGVVCRIVVGACLTRYKSSLGVLLHGPEDGITEGYLEADAVDTRD